MTPGADVDRRSGDDGVVGGGGGVDGGGVDGGDGGDAPRKAGSGGGGVFLGRGGGDARGGDWCTGSWCTPKPSSSDEFDGGDGGDASAASTPAIRTEGCPPATRLVAWNDGTVNMLDDAVRSSKARCVRSLWSRRFRAFSSRPSAPVTLHSPGFFAPR